MIKFCYYVIVPKSRFVVVNALSEYLPTAVWSVGERRIYDVVNLDNIPDSLNAPP